MHVDSFSCPKLFTTDGIELNGSERLLECYTFYIILYRHISAPQVILSLFLYVYILHGPKFPRFLVSNGSVHPMLCK